MRLHLCVVGRLKRGPEKMLVDDYLDRARRAGRALGISSVQLNEVEDRKGGGPAAEAALLRGALPRGALTCCLDERGRRLSSPGFAETLAGWRDTGRQDVAFVIGGADGIDPTLRDEAEMTLGFGEMVWPHMLARVMLSEQIYRATAILAGTPYHRA
ncbi:MULTISPECIES: 23S rRNA (pseudouridine(1915)-N(3))-methyltransferase RlmH [unclassified Roseivivax]|uniref:23S rRNA (pseudouridine(1915)-N(3))-methyltransferase RlmH n=1 Tax=Roseivivax sp. GX 12232 TaxID=2900547 RepID=UPI001E5336BF|nr:23S rRNA (pseudouridine(1915)-N(3))-methyltransferase RlmH [Roseivivax sp. GX 12232]MCE0505995.1 23S rRNA (pseudouridine(1915)-N(3))-methyltransferase RlmH [Roseivivax sp. GX 12232]